MKVAVVGGGVFGCATALDLAANGLDVELFESDTDLLTGSTARNMARLHSGYHYPRSISTAAASRDSAACFTERWPEAVRHDAKHWYALALDSKVSPAEYRRFLEQALLDYEEVGRSAGQLVRPPQLHTADMVVRAQEAFVDVDVLRRLMRREMSRASVSLHLSQHVEEPEIPGFDVTVWATYGKPWVRPLRYEVCEVALLELGRYTNDSFVVLDGDFVSLDPHGRLYTLYDVAHSVHHSNLGMAPEIPEEYADLIKRSASGPVRSPLSHLDAMIKSASRFLWGLEPDGGHVSIYHGSLWSIRAVLPGVDATDARPTLVERDGNAVYILSGKIGTAARVGEQVLKEIT